MFLGILNLSTAGIQIPLTPRSDQRDIRRQSLYRQLETNLVVTLARSTMSDSIRAFLLSDLDEFLCDDRTGKRRAEQVFILIDSTSLERRPYIFFQELFLEISDIDLGSTRLQGFIMNGIEFIALTDIGAGSDDFAAIIVFFEPGDDNGGIKTTGVSEYDFLDLFLCQRKLPLFLNLQISIST